MRATLHRRRVSLSLSLSHQEANLSLQELSGLTRGHYRYILQVIGANTSKQWSTLLPTPRHQGIYDSFPCGGRIHLCCLSFFLGWGGLRRGVRFGQSRQCESCCNPCGNTSVLEAWQSVRPHLWIRFSSYSFVGQT